MTCRLCDHCMTGKQMEMAGLLKETATIKDDWLYDHFCVKVKSGRRKIKTASDFNGREWPKWCPLREGGEAK